jgi:hypothetical protein
MNAIGMASDPSVAEVDGIGLAAPSSPKVNRIRRRFISATAIGMTVAAIPYLWVLFVLWNGAPNVFRSAYQNGYGDNFYDLQARAMLSGHLYVPKGSLGIEAWLHDGHTYTYFGLFPSLLRIPILLMTHSLDGKLTALSLLLAWLVTGLFTSMLLWRVRIMLRGNAPLGRAEAATFGILIATVLAGSVLVYLASQPYVYSEDMAWAVALSIGGFFALLGVLERPSWLRVTGCGLLIVAANLDRATDGYACVLGALLVAWWLAVKRRGTEHHRWWIPMIGVAVISVAAGSAVDLGKFGVLYGFPLKDYTAFHLLDQIQINDGRHFALLYLPSDLWTYLGPGGLRFTSMFPFITLPSGPARALGGVQYDTLNRTTSLTTSMPLLLLLGCVGVISVFRRRAGEVAAMLRILVIAAAAGAGGVLIFGTITDRYLADLLPVLIVSSAIGAVALWGGLKGRSRRLRLAITGVVAVLGVFGIVANVALSSTPVAGWSQTQASRFLQFQEKVGTLTGHPLADQTLTGNKLPRWAPAGTVFIAGKCNALYVSTGEQPRPTLYQQVEHSNWLVVEQGTGFAHTLRVTFGTPDLSSSRGITIVDIGHSSVLMHSGPAADGNIAVWFTLEDPSFPSTSGHSIVRPGTTRLISVHTDRFKDVIQLSMDGVTYFDNPMTAGAPAVVHTEREGNGDSFTIENVTGRAPSVGLCRSLSEVH